jgi:hypothetical protein
VLCTARANVVEAVRRQNFSNAYAWTDTKKTTQYSANHSHASSSQFLHHQCRAGKEVKAFEKHRGTAPRTRPTRRPPRSTTPRSGRGQHQAGCKQSLQATHVIVAETMQVRGETNISSASEVHALASSGEITHKKARHLTTTCQ